MNRNNKKKRNPFNLCAALLMGTGLLATIIGYVNAQAGDPSVIETPSHRFTEMAEGVYHVAGTGTVNVMSNALLVVGANDALVVDSHVTPNAANALLDAIGRVTNKPVRYLVNSHYHFDHAHGNQVFPADVEIIGHEYTRLKLNGDLGNVLEESTHISFTEGVPAQVESLRERVAAATDPAERATLEQQLAVAQAHLTSLGEVVPTPPNITLVNKMTLFQTLEQGSREIQLLHLGRAHTAGDVVVFLPQERMVFTGDLLVPSLSYMGDSFPLEWRDTLDALKTLDFDIILPGHGSPVQGKEAIDNFQAYLGDLWQKTSDLKSQGLTAKQVAEQIDMTNHAQNYRQIRGPGADVRAIRRIYALLDE